MAQPLREAIPTAIEQALEVRGCYVIELKADFELSVTVMAAVDGSLEANARDRGPRKGLLRRSREPLDRQEMAAIGFQPLHEIWMLSARAVPGAKERVVDAVERLYTGPYERSLDDEAELWFEYPGLVPGAPPPPPDATHEDHLRASMAVFELDPEADVLISAGVPNDLVLQFVLTGEKRVGVHVTGRDAEPPPPIDGYTESPEIEGALWAEHDRDSFPATAAALLHEHLGIAESDPLFVYLSSDVLP